LTELGSGSIEVDQALGVLVAWMSIAVASANSRCSFRIVEWNDGKDLGVPRT